MSGRPQGGRPFPRSPRLPSLGWDFRGQNTEAPSYPSGGGVPGSAPSLTPLTRKGLLPLSSLSSSLAAVSCGTSDGVGPTRLPMSPSEGSRRGRLLPEPDEPCTRLAPMGCGPESQRGIRTGVQRQAAPTLDRTAEGEAPQSVPVAPLPLHSYGIELGDYASSTTPKDYFQEPPSHWTSHSHGIQRHGTHP